MSFRKIFTTHNQPHYMFLKSVFCVYLSAYMCMQYPLRPGEGVRSPETGLHVEAETVWDSMQYVKKIRGGGGLYSRKY